MLVPAHTWPPYQLGPERSRTWGDAYLGGPERGLADGAAVAVAPIIVVKYAQVRIARSLGRRAAEISRRRAKVGPSMPVRPMDERQQHLDCQCEQGQKTEEWVPGTPHGVLWD